MRQLRTYKDKVGRTQITMAKTEAEQDQLCDFCSSQERPFKTFNCNDFPVKEGIISLSAWLACPPCAKLIDNRDTENLLHRSMAQVDNPEIPQWFMEKTLRTIHTKFFRNLINDN